MIESMLYVEQLIQEDYYEFPYHYIPDYGEEGFSQTRYWNWGFRYLAGIRVVQEQLEKISYTSLLDLGCGDGRFLQEMANLEPGIRLMGVDYSARAVALAQAFNPAVEFRAKNILYASLGERFDVITLIEVLEHFPPDDVENCLRVVVDHLARYGTFIMTVPHINVPVQEKHFQHFSSESLRDLLAPYFDDIRFIPFDGRSRFLRILFRLMGGQGKHYVVTNRRINRWFFDWYIRHCLYAGEDRCTRIMAVASRN
jgi:SAM-dependent methyltransferase